MGSCPSGDLSWCGIVLVENCPGGESSGLEFIVRMAECRSGTLLRMAECR